MLSGPFPLAVWGHMFPNMAHFSSISKAQYCECPRGRRNCAEPEAHKSVALGLGFFCDSTKVENLAAIGKNHSKEMTFLLVTSAAKTSRIEERS